MQAWLDQIVYSPVIIQPEETAQGWRWQAVTDIDAIRRGAVLVAPQKMARGDLSQVSRSISHARYEAPPGASAAVLTDALQAEPLAQLRADVAARYGELKTIAKEEVRKNVRKPRWGNTPLVVNPLSYGAFILDEPKLGTQEQELMDHSRQALAAQLEKLPNRWKNLARSHHVPMAICERLLDGIGHGAAVDHSGSVMFFDAAVLRDVHRSMQKKDAQEQAKFRRALSEELAHVADMRSGYTDQPEVREVFRRFLDTQNAAWNLMDTMFMRDMLASRSEVTFRYITQPKELLACMVTLKSSYVDELRNESRAKSWLGYGGSEVALESAANERLKQVVGAPMLEVLTQFERQVERMSGLTGNSPASAKR